MTPEKYTAVTPYSMRKREASVRGLKQAIRPKGASSTRMCTSVKYEFQAGG